MYSFDPQPASVSDDDDDDDDEELPVERLRLAHVRNRLLAAWPSSKAPLDPASPPPSEPKTAKRKKDKTREPKRHVVKIKREGFR